MPNSSSLFLIWISAVSFVYSSETTMIANVEQPGKVEEIEEQSVLLLKHLQRKLFKQSSRSCSGPSCLHSQGKSQQGAPPSDNLSPRNEIQLTKISSLDSSTARPASINTAPTTTTTTTLFTNSFSWKGLSQQKQHGSKDSFSMSANVTSSSITSFKTNHTTNSIMQFVSSPLPVPSTNINTNHEENSIHQQQNHDERLSCTNPSLSLMEKRRKKQQQQQIRRTSPIILSSAAASTIIASV